MHTHAYLDVHRRRKMLKVGWAQYPVARKVRAKFLRPRPLCDKPRPFLHDRDCYREFLDEKMNYKSNGIDLEAIEAHSLILASHCRLAGLDLILNCRY